MVREYKQLPLARALAHVCAGKLASQFSSALSSPPAPKRHCHWDLFPHTFSLIHPESMRLAAYSDSAKVNIPFGSGKEEEARSQINTNNSDLRLFRFR